MTRILLLPLLLLAACGRGDAPAEGDNGSAPAAQSKPAGPAPAAAAASLAGLYEGGHGEQKNQLCMVDKGEDTQFGLIVWGANLHSCSGVGQAVRKGEVLTLKMTGDESCTMDARFNDGVVTLPDALPEGCAYYCGGRATLAKASFTRTGSTPADALKATDIAGDPLCG